MLHWCYLCSLWYSGYWQFFVGKLLLAVLEGRLAVSSVVPEQVGTSSAFVVVVVVLVFAGQIQSAQTTSNVCTYAEVMF